MSSHSEKLKSLVDALIKKTSANELKWEAVGTTSASAPIPSGTIMLSSGQDRSGQDAILVNVFDAKGECKITFDDTDVYDWDPDGGRISYFSTMQNLLADALRSARGESKLL